MRQNISRGRRAAGEGAYDRRQAGSESGETDLQRHVTDKDGKYEITEKGRRNVNTVASSLPYTVRAKADRLTAPVAASMSVSEMLKCVAVVSANDCAVALAELLCGTEEAFVKRMVPSLI